MKRTRGYADSKMAAAGDRDDDAEMPLWEPQSLPVALVPSQTSQRTTQVLKAVVEPQSEVLPIAGEVRIVEENPYDVGLTRFQEIMDRFPIHWVPGMSRFLQEDREVVAEFGYNTANHHICMGLGYANGHQLNGGKISLPLVVKNNLDENVIVLEKLHSMIYRMTMDRNNLVNIEEESFSGVLLEVGFYSRVVGSDKKDYLGKIKAFFPKTSNKMVFYLDLSKIK